MLGLRKAKENAGSEARKCYFHSVFVSIPFYKCYFYGVFVHIQFDKTAAIGMLAMDVVYLGRRSQHDLK